MRKNKKKSSLIKKKVTGSEVALMHKAERPSNYFFPAPSHIIKLSR